MAADIVQADPSEPVHNIKIIKHKSIHARKIILKRLIFVDGASMKIAYPPGRPKTKQMNTKNKKQLEQNKESRKQHAEYRKRRSQIYAARHREKLDKEKNNIFILEFPEQFEEAMKQIEDH